MFLPCFIRGSTASFGLLRLCQFDSKRVVCHPPSVPDDAFWVEFDPKRVVRDPPNVPDDPKRVETDPFYVPNDLPSVVHDLKRVVRA